ncbi:MAG: MGH1-like glycoside hydrolase domain-containing protein [Oryzihumus sp.]
MAEQQHPVTAEHARLAAAHDEGGQDWAAWGPYLSERAWGTVREDYSATGEAWDFLPHDAARSKAYRWNEDGLAGVCDRGQTWCLALALWNGVDPILKERAFGLAGPEGNHGEDAKEYWWYLDSTPTHSWMRWRYHYPQRKFPYTDLVQQNRGRGKDDPEYGLVDTGVFDEGRFWAVTVDYAKAGPTDLCLRVTVRNHGPDEAALHVLPTLWFRNTWAWGRDDYRPEIRAEDHRLVAVHHDSGPLVLAGDGSPEVLACENETNFERLYGVANTTPWPKDGISDRVVSGAASVNPEGVGTKAALHYTVTVPAGGSREIRLRLSRPSGEPDLGGGFAWTMQAREEEADEYYRALTPAGTSADEALVLRQALAGLLWSKQYYAYDVRQWLDGDPAGPPPPPQRQQGRNSRWKHVANADVISMPDTWEYPWYAAWDLAFHTAVLAHVDPRFAKNQLLLMTTERYMHPNGQLPAYEWAFGDVNPPVHAWAALEVFRIDGGTDTDFLERIFHKLIANFTWWLNCKDPDGNNLFEGGFLGLDNIGLFDRSAPMPSGVHLEQADSTAWMVMYALDMFRMAMVLAEHDPTYEDMAIKFARHAITITVTANQQGLWDEEDGFYYDRLRTDDGRVLELKVRSMVGVVPLFAVAVVGERRLSQLRRLVLTWAREHAPELVEVVETDERRHVLSLIRPDRLVRVLGTVLDEEQFLSPYGLRSMSAWHRDHPLHVQLRGTDFSVDYEPGESHTVMFGGNSNWRGPVWFPLNYLAVQALRTYEQEYGARLTVEHPAGSGRHCRLGEVADDLSARLVSIFCEDAGGRRPVFGDCELFQTDPAWHDLIPFYEYFHGDTGAGLGAGHQTGWTALVANLILQRGDRATAPRPADVPRAEPVARR